MSPGHDPQAFADLIAAAVADDRRLDAVHRSGLLDTPAERGFDRIATLAGRLLGTPLAFITVVDASRSFWKACIGVDTDDPGDRHNPVQDSFCQYVIGLGEALLIDDARLDPRTEHNASIDAMGLRAWAGAPLRADGGEILGTLCVVDTKVRSWGPQDAETLHDLAAIAVDEIKARQLAAEATRVRSVLDGVLQRSPIGIGLFDHELRYEMVNEALAELNSRTVEQHLGASIYDIAPGIADTVVPHLQSILDGVDSHTDVEVREGGSVRPQDARIWSSNYFGVDIGPDTRRVGVIVSDETERVRATHRAERLAELTRRLADAAAIEEVSAVLEAGAGDYVGADRVWFGLHDPFTGEMRLSSGETEPTLSGQSFNAEDPMAYGAALRSGESVFVSDADDRRNRFPESVELTESLGVVATAAVPLRVSRGLVVGVMLYGWTRRVEQAEFPRYQLHTLADVASQAIERVKVAGDRRQLVDSMRRATMVPVPPVEGLEVVARYEAATSALGFGGDWYDVLALDGGLTAMVVGDVAGHDPTAAAQMTRVRTIVSALLRLGVPLVELFERAEELLADGERAMASVVVMVADPAERRLSIVSAGHLPPILVSPDGTATRIEGRPHPWLGVSGEAPEVLETAYEPGSLLVAYTDGLVEHRGRPIDDDIAALMDALIEVRGESLGHISARLVAGRRASTRVDDIALVIARL